MVHHPLSIFRSASEPCLESFDARHEISERFSAHSKKTENATALAAGVRTRRGARVVAANAGSKPDRRLRVNLKKIEVSRVGGLPASEAAFEDI
jgi:hypothetical protein